MSRHRAVRNRAYSYDDGMCSASECGAAACFWWWPFTRSTRALIASSPFN